MAEIRLNTPMLEFSNRFPFRKHRGGDVDKAGVCSSGRKELGLWHTFCVLKHELARRNKNRRDSPQDGCRDSSSLWRLQ